MPGQVPVEVIDAAHVVDGVEHRWVIVDTITSNIVAVRIVGRRGDRSDLQLLVELGYNEHQNSGQEEDANELLDGHTTVLVSDPNLSEGMFSIEIDGYNNWAPGYYFVRVRYGEPTRGYATAESFWQVTPP